MCGPADSFPFPMRKVTKADMEALRSGVAWKADKERAMITKEGKGMGKHFAPNMRNPMDKSANYGLVKEKKDADTQSDGYLSNLMGNWKLFGGDSGDAYKAHYNVNPTASQFNSVSGKPLMMPYFFEKEENLKRSTPTAVKMQEKKKYGEAAMRIQRMFQAKNRSLPKRVEALYEKEFAKQKAIRDDARLRLQNEFNAQPTENEVEDLAMQHPEARSRQALLQRLIYDIAVQGEWTEPEVYELMRADLRRGDGHVIIVSTEFGKCSEAYKGIASELEDQEMARKILKTTLIDDSRIKSGSLYGKRAGQGSLGEFFGVGDSFFYQAAQQKS